VFLHNILFQQYQSPKGSNKPTGAILDFIVKHYKDFDKFKEAFAKEAMSIQGSGWVYLAKDGKIKTIKNHEIKKDIVLLIDWWEHAWALDYQHDKKKYLENQWKIINWDHINEQSAV
jgi:Fe-Mn family superoxide dismutase